MITKAKDLSAYVITITQRSPKQFRFTFVSRMQNLCLDVIEFLFRANDTYVEKGDQAAWTIRADFQCRAMTNLKLLAYVSLLAMENKCILPRQDILAYMDADKYYNAGDILNGVPSIVASGMSINRVSALLTQMTDAGWVTKTVDKRVNYYSLA